MSVTDWVRLAFYVIESALIIWLIVILIRLAISRRRR